MNVRFLLDICDRLNAYQINTVLECTPTFRLFLDEDIDCDRLKSAVSYAFEVLPYFRTRLIFDDRFCFESNSAEFPINHCRLEDRPDKFGKSSGDYTLQISYYKNELIFDMTHIQSDTLGFLYFIKAVVSAYFGVHLPYNPELYLKLPYEDNFDKNTPFLRFESRKKVSLRTWLKACRTEEAVLIAHCFPDRLTGFLNIISRLIPARLQ